MCQNVWSAFQLISFLNKLVQYRKTSMSIYRTTAIAISEYISLQHDKQIIAVLKVLT